MDDKEKLIQIISDQDWIMNALRIGREMNLPDWYIAAGAIRNTIWNYLHGFDTRINQNDVDFVYFNSSNLDKSIDKEYETLLQQKHPQVKWEVVNQARGHLMYHGPNINRPQAKSSWESIAYWSETATCIGLRLESDDSFTICAPHGLSDLMNLIVRPTPAPYTELPLYKERLVKKKWKEIWPKLTIIDC